MPRFEAPSISRTSKLLPATIAVQEGHASQGESVGPLAQLSALARMRAVEVFPVPRGPLKR